VEKLMHASVMKRRHWGNCLSRFAFCVRAIGVKLLGMWKKVAAALVACAFIFGVGLFLGLMGYRFLGHRFGFGGLLNTATVVKKVQTLSQFTTVRYTLEKVVVFEDAKWYGDSRVLLIAHGVVKAGLDLDRLGPNDIQIEGKKIHITLPRPRVTDVYLDDHSTQIVERSTGLLRTFDKDLEQNARAAAVEELRLGALQNGILKDAAERGQAQLTILLYQLGFADIDLRSK
jgi:hypothetical protein